MSVSAPDNQPTSKNPSSEIANGLSRVLAETYSIYLKTQNYHWNVKGPLFHTLHAMFEVQYTELAVAIDEIAERIRALGEPAPGSFSEFGRLSNIKEETGLPTPGDDFEFDRRSIDPRSDMQECFPFGSTS